MIGSITKQPDYKIFLNWEEVQQLKDWATLWWKFYDHITKKIVELTLSQSIEISNWVTRNWPHHVILSKPITEELEKDWFIGWLRLNGITVKTTIVVKEKIKNLWISPDDKMSLEWALEDLENLINT